MCNSEFFGFKTFQEFEKSLIDHQCEKQYTKLIPIEKTTKERIDERCEEFMNLLSLCNIFCDYGDNYFKYAFIRDILDQDMENIKNNNIPDLKECNRLGLGKKIKFMKKFLKRHGYFN